jgi:hypothetical protein
LFAVLITCGIVIASVSLHYEALHLLAAMLRRKKRWYSNRLRASLLVLGCIVAHGVEVIFFGIGMRLVEAIYEGVDLDLLGTAADGFNYMYYSLVVYTSIGFGDIIPVSRPMRIITAGEGLTGAILIAWTASFMFFHMQRFWAVDQLPAEDDG